MPNISQDLQLINQLLDKLTAEESPNFAQTTVYLNALYNAIQEATKFFELYYKLHQLFSVDNTPALTAAQKDTLFNFVDTYLSQLAETPEAERQEPTQQDISHLLETMALSDDITAGIKNKLALTHSSTSFEEQLSADINEKRERTSTVGDDVILDCFLSYLANFQLISKTEFSLQSLQNQLEKVTEQANEIVKACQLSGDEKLEPYKIDSGTKGIPSQDRHALANFQAVSLSRAPSYVIRQKERGKIDSNPLFPTTSLQKSLGDLKDSQAVITDRQQAIDQKAETVDKTYTPVLAELAELAEINELNHRDNPLVEALKILSPLAPPSNSGPIQDSGTLQGIAKYVRENILQQGATPSPNLLDELNRLNFPAILCALEDSEQFKTQLFNKRIITEEERDGQLEQWQHLRDQCALRLMTHVLADTEKTIKAKQEELDALKTANQENTVYAKNLEKFIEKLDAFKYETGSAKDSLSRLITSASASRQKINWIINNQKRRTVKLLNDKETSTFIPNNFKERLCHFINCCTSIFGWKPFKALKGHMEDFATSHQCRGTLFSRRLNFKKRTSIVVPGACI